MRQLCTAALLLSLTVTAWAQSPAPLAPQAEAQPSTERDRAIRRTRVEGQSVVIEEVRYGGETQSIEVTPRYGATPYQIVPSDPAHNFPGALGSEASAAGQRVWKLFDF